VEETESEIEIRQDAMAESVTMDANLWMYHGPLALRGVEKEATADAAEILELMRDVIVMVQERTEGESGVRMRVQWMEGVMTRESADNRAFLEVHRPDTCTMVGDGVAWVGVCTAVFHGKIGGNVRNRNYSTLL